MDNLPHELIIHILSLCEPIALVTCLAVCKLFCKLIAESASLQYHIELFADGMIETHLPSTLPPAERLSRLRSRRAAWKELNWIQRPSPTISAGLWSAYELVDGIFSKTFHLSEIHNARGIIFTTLPSKDSPGTLTKFDNVGVPFRDFAMDPTQDLIVFMQCSPVSGSLNRTLITLHFRTMSNNRSHPRAVEPLTSIVLDSIDVVAAVIQTVNDVVGFMACDENCSHLYVWDWMRCKLLVAESSLYRSDDFAFVSSRSYVVTSINPEPCLRIYTFDANPRARVPPASPTHRATLRLPQMRDGGGASQLSIHTGPYTTTPTSQSLRVGTSKAFIQDSRCRIHIIGLESWGFNEPTACLAVVHNSTFLRFTTEESDADDDSGPEELEWSEWGPDRIRWLPGRIGSSWLRYVHGERLVRLHATTENGPHDLEVYDFGAPRGPPSWYDQSEDTVSVLRSSFFAEPVVGRLPCRIVKKRGKFPYSGFMIDEERLIGLKNDFANETGSIDVFTF